EIRLQSYGCIFKRLAGWGWTTPATLPDNPCHSAKSGKYVDFYVFLCSRIVRTPVNKSVQKFAGTDSSIYIFQNEHTVKQLNKGNGQLNKGTGK
ncbi:MAG: hypothetical protein LBE91_07700, partial [Tannerella sp.]|nr:hypothetical protein [Tannerella sp.]